MKFEPMVLPEDGRNEFKEILSIDILFLNETHDSERIIFYMQELANYCSKFGYSVSIELAPNGFLLKHPITGQEIEISDNSRGYYFVATFNKLTHSNT